RGFQHAIFSIPSGEVALYAIASAYYHQRFLFSEIMPAPNSNSDPAHLQSHLLTKRDYQSPERLSVFTEKGDMP
ncbi:MAG TPA: hypothetical protein VL091_00215, partial [Marinobacter sp.]|nr:hypothetical protein [Marinobacter sp.]